MTNQPQTLEPKPPDPGELAHWLVSGMTFQAIVKGQAVGLVSRRGSELAITAGLLDANRDRFGRLAPVFALLHSPAAQLRRLGQQVIGSGPWPIDLLVSTPGEMEHEDARRESVRQAKALATEEEREAALRDVERLFGPAIPTSRTLADYAGDGQTLARKR